MKKNIKRNIEDAVIIVMIRTSNNNDDGLTLVAWQSGRSATWDVTVVHTATHWLHLTCRRVRYRQQAHRLQRQRGSRPNTAASYPAIFSVQWLLRRWVLWRMKLSISWQRLAGGRRAAQPMRGKLRFCTRESPWQFSVSTQCAWPIRWQFPSPHRNHFGHRHYTLLISKSLGNEVPWAKKYDNNNWIIIITIN